MKVIVDDPIMLEEPEAYSCKRCLGIEKSGVLCRKMSCRSRRAEYRLLRMLIQKNEAR